MRKNENGRSMIEMLGVLAIIGVLSVGGIYGYTVAMRKYKANEVAQTASMLATLAHAKNAGEGGTVVLNASGLNDNPGGVTLVGNTTKAECTTEGEGAAATTNCAVIKVTLNSNDSDWSNIKKAVCQIVPKSAEAGTTAGYYVDGCAAETP